MAHAMQERPIELFQEFDKKCDKYCELRRSYRWQICGVITGTVANIGMKIVSEALFAQRGLPQGELLTIEIGIHGMLLLVMSTCIKDAMDIRRKLQPLLSSIYTYYRDHQTIDTDNALRDRGILI